MSAHLLQNTIIEREAILLSQGSSFLGLSVAELRTKRAEELIETLRSFSLEEFEIFMKERYRRVADRKKVAKAEMELKLFVHSQQSAKVFGV